jgi:hypothetical protein
MMRDADPDSAFHFDADANSDPDPTFHPDADPNPDPAFHFGADANSDPDPTFHSVADRILRFNLMRIPIRILLLTFSHIWTL